MVTSDRDGLIAQAADLAERGYEAFKGGDTDGSRQLNAQSLAIARQASDPPSTARALAGLMRVGLRESDFEEVERLARDCDAVAEAANDPSLRRMSLHMRAECARIQGDLTGAQGVRK